MPGRVWEKAAEVAANQYGFITFNDMRCLKADPTRLRRWRMSGKIDRVGHGIYRFKQIPATPLDPYMLATLWPAGRGVLSHDTALELHELCDINPDKIHVTVGPGYRPRRKGGDRYVVHYESLDEDDLDWHEGIRIVTPGVAIRQGLTSSVPIQLLRQAIDKARRLGLVSPYVLNVLSLALEQRNDKPPVG